MEFSADDAGDLSGRGGMAEGNEEAVGGESKELAEGELWIVLAMRLKENFSGGVVSQAD